MLYWALKTIGNALVAGLVGVDELVMTPLVELVLKPFHYLWYSVVEVRYSDAARTITSKWFHRLSAFLIVVGMAASLYGLSKVIPGRIPAQPI